MGIIKKQLFDANASLYVLSVLMHKPLLLQQEKYNLTTSDFNPHHLHEIVFGAIYNLAQVGVEKITSTDIDLQIKQSETAYNYYEKNQGYEWVLSCFQLTEQSDDKQFDLYYNRLKKFSVLRDLERAGINTSQFYDPDKDILNKDAEDLRLNNETVQGILNTLRTDLAEIENKHVGKDNGNAQIASTSLRTLVQHLKETPEVGLPIDGEIINWATRGAREGKMYIYSAPSGGGKTRFMVGNACAISLPYLDVHGDIVMRKDYRKVLFVATEMQADEIQTLILSYVSGVNEKSILLGRYTQQEEERINRALDILDKYGKNFIIECIPDPSINLIKARLTKYIIQDNIEYIFYDYIFSSPGLLSEFRDVAVREDVALMMLSNTLKEIAMSYNIFIQSATQLNDGWSKKEIGLRDQNCIRGSKAIADKVDIGMIGVRLGDEERKQIEGIWQEVQLKNHYTHAPNIVVDIYKNRRGEMNCVKVFRYFDYATCRCEDLFVTDASYKGIDCLGEFKCNTESINYYDFLDLKVEGAK